MSFPMNSSSASDAQDAVAALINVSTESVVNAIQWRERKSSEIQMHAMSEGMYPTVEFVNRHFAWFLRWHNRGISKGYLINRTGVPTEPPTKDGGE